ncbi:hypothetical protein ABEB36_009202 [Hypothenemus hampei]|uniref:Regulatory protein zeste n=1 Tax=Hypothenemus hampei TaxID=57062 RepID=A0ABD1EPG7_HYPHA
MSSKQIGLERKMQFLTKIRENKDILFGAFSEKLRKQDKIEKWKEMAMVAQSICLLPADKDWTYVRDTIWQNLKKTAMLKIDNAKKTGTGGMGTLTEVDNMVLSIIGKESPVICGLGVAESFEKPQDQSCEVVTENDSEGIINKSRSIRDHVNPSTSKEAKGGKRKRVTDKNASTDNESAIKEEKLTLQVEYLKLKNYRTKLEILKLEKNFNCPCLNLRNHYHNVTMKLKMAGAIKTCYSKTLHVTYKIIISFLIFVLIFEI